MRKTVMLIAFLLGSAAVSQLHAQAMKNTNWKFYVEPLHDTLTMHVGTDSSYCTTSSGEVVVRSTIKVDKDTVKMSDFGGEYACDGEGVYKYAIDGDVLIFTLVNDPCVNRSGALVGTKFFKVPASAK